MWNQVIKIKSTYFVVIKRRDAFVCTALHIITRLYTTETNAKADSVSERWYSEEDQDWH